MDYCNLYNTIKAKQVSICIIHLLLPGSSVQQPSVKKRVSLADYKKRKQRASESGGTGTPTTAPSTPNLATGLPSSMPSLPSLPSLPGLDMPSQTFARSKAEKLQDKGEELFFF